MTKTVNIIGAGLAGCEAAWQASRLGVKVRLYEMKPQRMSPAHHSEYFAELVCSNSLRSDAPENAVGVLKEEMRRMNSLIIGAADICRIPAGSALAVDRTGFSKYITDTLEADENIEIIRKERISFDEDEITVIATGPLTDGEFFRFLEKRFGDDHLSFFDAAAPIVERKSINMEHAFFASRYGKGDADYINCPLTREEYDAFYEALINAKTAKLHGFEEKGKVFEGCMPLEVMAGRGHDTLLFGPMKPVGLVDPKTGKEPYAALQLRQDNAAASMYNLVGCQTHLTFSEQKRVFGMIPALENAEFLRYGVMHRNTFINSPRLLTKYYNTRECENIFFAGQITGVEGYVESASSGLLAGLNAALLALGRPLLDLTNQTASGALSNYVSDPNIKNFQPMNANFGIMDMSLKVKGGKKARNLKLYERAVEIAQREYKALQGESKI